MENKVEKILEELVEKTTDNVTSSFKEEMMEKKVEIIGEATDKIMELIEEIKSIARIQAMVDLKLKLLKWAKE